MYVDGERSRWIYRYVDRYREMSGISRNEWDIDIWERRAKPAKQVLPDQWSLTDLTKDILQKDSFVKVLRDLRGPKGERSEPIWKFSHKDILQKIYYKWYIVNRLFWRRIERKAGFARQTGPHGPVITHRSYKKNNWEKIFLQFSDSENFRKSTENRSEKIHFCEVQKIFDFPKMKKSQKLQKKWQNKASGGYRPIITKKIFFRPSAGSRLTVSYITNNIFHYIFCW